ncbi:MAG: 50S ribosome-binding GTPase [Candidatus Shikimatogenerans sp. JK-2022]|nr:50S ribosome-binding GTPase [Candidatus Shikimatogenerans bostrichidophilus]
MLYNNFIDKINIFCIGGNGGHGKISFLKKQKKIGKPNGGNGGKGGDIIFFYDYNLFSFYNLKNKYIYKAYNGFNGMSNCKNGKNGKDYLINIPHNTIIKYKKKNKNKILIKKNKKKKEIKFFLGGKGGKGNYYFKSSSNQKSRKYTLGEKGKKILIKLKLRFKIDIGIIGLPNTGKTTFFSKITNSKPKIDYYNFTTIIPNIGIYKIKEKKFIIIDFPALIANSYKGKGLGSKYIKRYIKTCKKVFIFLFNYTLKKIKEEIKIIKKEICFYKINIKKNFFFFLSKYDLLKKNNIKKIKNYFFKKKYKFYLFSNKNKNKKNINIINNILLNKN